MKRILLLVSILGTFLFSSGIVLFDGYSLCNAGELGSNIMRRVNAANDYLDKAEEQIKGGRAEHAPRQIAGAQKEYDNIFNYYKGSFDPTHPTLVNLKKRIDTVNSALTAAQSPAAAVATPTPATQPGKTGLPSSSAKQVSAKVPASPAGAQKELSANIRRRLDQANRKLNYVFERAAKGEDASISLAGAKKEYDNIFSYYKGTFDPNHPDILALKDRIAEAEGAMRKGIASKNAERRIETNRRVVNDLPPEMGEALLDIGGDLATLENSINTARTAYNPGSYLAGLRSSLSRAKENFDTFNSKYKGKIAPGHVAFQQVMRRLDEGTAAISEIERKASSAASAKDAERVVKYDAKAKKIMNTYKDQEPTSKLHSKNAGRMVWSTKPINFKDQDRITTQSTFKLTDPIFGRLYLKRSLGNTPVYGDGKDARPSENYQFRYVYRLFIDGQEKVDRSEVFLSGRLKGKAGETWTTFQFAPNPVPYDKDFSNEAEAWRRVTSGIAPGTHKVRFELWGQQGQFRSLEPVSIGEFSLVVGEGERIAAGMKFPGDSYTGRDVDKIRSEMMKALVGPVAKKRNEVLKISVTGDWRHGVYRDSKVPYRMISGTVLWHDKDNDNICRFTTVNFISDSLGGNSWTPVRYRSFSAGREGDTECP